MPKNKKKNKDEKALNTWIPIGVMIGTILGMILSFKYNNFFYLYGSASGGLLVGTLIGSFLADSDMKGKVKKKK